jgi:hypothetical protein
VGAQRGACELLVRVAGGEVQTEEAANTAISALDHDCDRESSG